MAKEDKDKEKKAAAEDATENTEKEEKDNNTTEASDNKNKDKKDKSEKADINNININDELEKTKKALKDANDKYIRLFAEFDNYRKRTTKEKTESYNDAVASCVKEILPVIDNFELAMTHPCEDENFLKGMEMILKQFRTILDKMNVKEIDALGKKFDPNLHNAIRQAESDKYETDTVCEVYQKGYMLENRLIRPAMVAVVK